LAGEDLRQPGDRTVGTVEDLIVDLDTLRMRYMLVRLDKDAVATTRDRRMRREVGVQSLKRSGSEGGGILVRDRRNADRPREPFGRAFRDGDLGRPLDRRLHRPEAKGTDEGDSDQQDKYGAEQE
jgi:hypothetical protein